MTQQTQPTCFTRLAIRIASIHLLEDGGASSGIHLGTPAGLGKKRSFVPNEWLFQDFEDLVVNNRSSNVDSVSDSEYFRNILESSPGWGEHLSRDDGYGRKCCRYIYYVKLVTDAAANSSLIGDVRTAVFGQKENTGKGEYGKGTFRADQFCIFDTYGQWLGMTCSFQAQ